MVRATKYGRHVNPEMSAEVLHIYGPICSTTLIKERIEMGGERDREREYERVEERESEGKHKRARERARERWRGRGREQKTSGGMAADFVFI